MKIGDVCSDTITIKGGIPQGTRLAQILFAILVTTLASDWRYRVKYVDDAPVFEVIPRNSPSYLSHVAADINSFAISRNMRLNAKKCKQMVVNFLHYNSAEIPPLFINGTSNRKSRQL